MKDDPEFPPIQKVREGRTTLVSATEERLRQAIHEGRFAPGSRLPSELELVVMLGVSRTTLREALRSLEEQKLIVRRRGLGTYAREGSIVKDLSINFGITEMIRQANQVPGTCDESISVVPASPAVAKALNLPKDSRVLVVDRVRTANERPVVWSQDILPVSLLDGEQIELLFLESHSIYEYYQTRLHIAITQGRAQISAIPASAEVSRKLHIPRGQALIRMDQIDYDFNDRPVLYSIEYSLPDAFVFVVHRRGPHR